jgi:hypothetical protein
MRVEVVSGDELLITIDADELPGKATARALAAKLPRSASGIAAEVVKLLDAPKPAGVPVTVRAVTVKLVRTQLIAAETLLLAAEREIFP